MKDLDFDELDKAVNSLMTGVSKTTEKPHPNDKEEALDITPARITDTPVSLDKVSDDAASIATPVEDQKKEVVAAVVAKTPVVSTPPATRRAGRFMDVVHPSSDMTKPGVPSRPTSRQGITIERRLTSGGQVPLLSSPVAEPIADAKEKSELTTSSETSAPASEWPDPLAMTDFAKDTLPKEEEWSAPSATSAPTPHNNEPSPLTSPFLPDTKVEKRPLGSSASVPIDELNTDDVAPREDKTDKTIDDPADQLPPMPSDTPPQLPEELQDELMAVEADTHMGVPKTELTHPSDEKLESGLPKEPATSASPVTPSGPVSIPQQYREEPSTGDTANAGIYDTDSYHQPLAHPAKKKSGWMWIVWIIIILLVGAGAGAALYFSGLV